MTYSDLVFVPLAWYVFGFFGALFMYVEFRLKRIELSEENTNKHIEQEINWGFISFVLGFYNLCKTIKSL